MSDPIPKRVVNPTPKQVLMNDKALLSLHRDFVRNPALSRCIELALANYIRKLTDRGAIDGYSSSSNFQRITGANELIAELKALGESQETPKPTSTEKLNHTV